MESSIISKGRFLTSYNPFIFDFRRQFQTVTMTDVPKDPQNGGGSR